MPDTRAVRSPAGASYRFDAAAPDHLARAIDDLATGLGRWRLAFALAWLDLRNRYRGSVLGPLWLTLSTAAMLLGLGLLYSQLLRLPLREYIPHLAVSLVVWNAISGLVTDATASLASQEGMIRQMRLPYSVHMLRCVFRNALIAAHNLPLVFLVLLATGQLPGPEALLALLGLAIIAINALAATAFLGMLCARFRDIGQIVTSVMQLAFFMTPIMWKPELLGAYQWTVILNPFYAILETVRGPLIEGGGPLSAWIAAVLYTSALVALALAFFIRYRGRIAFWV
jgi:lipopolysaccharide transport system permease protein